MSKLGVLILSGSCCNPAMIKTDKQIETIIGEIAEELSIEVVIKTLTISTAAMSGLGLGKELDSKVKNLIAEKGLSVLPIVFINGSIAFYSQIPEKEKLYRIINMLLAKSGD